ncbi:MAG TPA: NUDIX hydrolase [Thermoplasmata archaeon]|nr:NUDIX hydrolase [Thermoplasmata archaeon]
MTGSISEQLDGREYPSKPLVGVGVVTIRDGKVLLIKRAFEPAAGKWSIPGGLVEVGEKLSEAGQRETEEETGLKVQILELINVFDVVEKDDAGRVRYHYVLVDFLARSVGGEERRSEEVLEMKWVSHDEMKGMDLARTAKRALDELFGAPII